MNYKILFLVTCIACGPVRAQEAAASDILTGLRKEHPRLIITTGMWKDLRERRTTDPDLDKMLNWTTDKARKVLKAPPLVYQKRGQRLLEVSREALRRIQLCGFAYQLTGDKEFLLRAEKDMLAAADFQDWNPPHFLDTGEMTAALAFGYDWLFDALPETTRAKVRQAIVEKGIKPGLSGPHAWFKDVESNWNQVCLGGLTLGALAIADEEPEIARKLLTQARAKNPKGLKAYAPDGIYPEGPGYWHYGTEYQVMMLQALRTALGTDWDLSKSPGFLESGAVMVMIKGPTGRPFNYSDTGDTVWRFNPLIYWFAQWTKHPGLVYSQTAELKKQLAGKGDLPLFFPIWFMGMPDKIPPPKLPLAWHGDGPNSIGVFRSSWTDPNALFLAFKGGKASLPHGHMDAGSFVLDADGIRWASDLGTQEYGSVESKGWKLFLMTQKSDRWRVFRLNNFSHNTLTLGGKLHQVNGNARITESTANTSTIDLTPVFDEQAKSVIRRFAVGGNRMVGIRDEISGAQPGLSVRWQMVTHTEIAVNGERATLRKDGKVLVAKIVSPAGAKFSIASAQPPDDGVNVPNPDTQILAVDSVIPATGALKIEVHLQPGNE